MGLGRALPSWLVYMRARVRMLDFSSGLLQRPRVQKPAPRTTPGTGQSWVLLNSGGLWLPETR